MIAVITGDIVNSRELPLLWMETLKEALSAMPQKNTKWEIFRGDSFQIELPSQQAFLTSVYIKACMRTIKGADVRLSIGLGEKVNLLTSKVTEANGEAYINSGESFDGLKSSKVNLAIKSPSTEFDEDMNLYFKLALIAMDSWSPIASEVVKQTIENQNENQDKIAKISGRSQSSISEALKRAHFSEIMELEKKYRLLISKTFK
ncbi:transcriptional regulator [Pedobacter ureilyticus]|uniref:Transcriptional regulator n=1 Tax=Pedobacter ureilyticus TaxID=1393051 RepID=A0ABW9JCY5_9SPHI|nr:transcriptional regulator [Pedobacter helvus]